MARYEMEKDLINAEPFRPPDASTWKEVLVEKRKIPISNLTC